MRLKTEVQACSHLDELEGEEIENASLTRTQKSLIIPHFLSKDIL